MLSRSNVAATTPFDPLSIAGCKLWLKADAIVGLVDGDPVGTWSDQSGIGNDATQTTAGSKPLYKTGIINSKPTVLFDGSDDFMSYGITGIPSNGSMSIFLVVQPTLNTASQKSYATFIHGQGATFFIVARLATNFWGTFTTADLSSGNALTAGSKYLLENTRATASTFLYQRGTQVAFSASIEVGSGTPPSIGKDTTNANRQYAGHIAEILVYNTVLSDPNRILVENYLISKYAL